MLGPNPVWPITTLDFSIHYQVTFRLVTYNQVASPQFARKAAAEEMRDKAM
jgi:hypothetical protein